MADLFRDSPFGQLMRLGFNREIAMYEDERPGFKLKKCVKDESERALLGDEDEDDDDESDMRSMVTSVGDYTKSRSTMQTVRQPRSEKPDRTIRVVGFIEGKDRDNPHNWSSMKKAFVLIQISLLTFAIYSGTSILTPGEEYFMEHWGVNPEVAVLQLSMYVLGYGLGPLFFSPMSEVPEIGRNIAYVTSFSIFIILTAVGSGVSNYPGLVVIRLLQGFFGGPVLATGPASLSDIYSPNKVPYALATLVMFTGAGPALGPPMSGFAISLGTWRWGQWETLMICFVTYIVLFFCLPETNADYILAQRAKRLRARTGDESIKTKAEVHTANRNWGKLVAYHLTMPFKITFMDPSIFFLNLYMGLMYGIYYSFFESFPLVYPVMYGMNIGVSSLLFLAVLIGGFVGLVIYLLLVWFVYEPYTVKHGVGHPEWRLFPGIFAAAAQPIGIFMFGYTARSSIPWIVPTLGVGLFASTAFIILNVTFVYLPLSYPQYSASVFAANGFFRAVIPCGSIHFAHPLFGNLGVGDGCAILGSCSGLCAGIYLLMYLKGPWLRSKSRFAQTY